MYESLMLISLASSSVMLQDTGGVLAGNINNMEQGLAILKPAECVDAGDHSGKSRWELCWRCDATGNGKSVG